MQFSLVVLQATAAAAAAITQRGGSNKLNKREDWTGDGNVEIYISDQSRSFNSNRRLIPN